jgi:hypothetical protein
MTGAPDATRRERGSALSRLASLARRGKAHYTARAAELIRWLRTPTPSAKDTADAEVDVTPTSNPSPLRRIFTVRHLQQRQQAHRGSGGARSSTAVEALERASKLRDQED